ncbi:MAG TPA: hypothetical protein PKG49_00935 [Nitrosomonas mobilis]|nr:hypothetical protein [Nitrosomonas mobilis]
MQLKLFVVVLCLIALPIPSKLSAQTPDVTQCKGCLCPGDPCRLCPLPLNTADPVPDDEPQTCRRIRETVSPISDLPGSNEYFTSLDKATLACIRNGGDVLKNSSRSSLFPARFYCKPGLVEH